MKNTFYLLPFLLLMIISCNGDDEISTPPTPPDPDVQPTAAFTAPNFIQTNCPVLFTSTSSDASSYAWDFGDGNTSTSESPSHSYIAAGPYTVKLTVKNGELEDETTSAFNVLDGTFKRDIIETAATVIAGSFSLGDDIIVGASFWGGSAGISNKVYRLDEQGDIIWNKTFGGNNKHEMKDLCRMDDQNFLAVSTVEFNTGYMDDYGYVKFDENGNEIWKNHYEYGGQQRAEGAIASANNTAIVYGTDFYNTQFSGYVISINGSDGSRNWGRLITPTSGVDNRIFSAIQNSDGCIILGGSQTTTSTGVTKSLLVKLDSDGNIVWDKTGSLLSQPTIRKLVRLDNNTIMVVGNQSITKMDNEGNPAFTKNFNSTNNFIIRDAKLIDNNKLLVLGSKGPSALMLVFNTEGDLQLTKEHSFSGIFDVFIDGFKSSECTYTILGNQWNVGSSNFDPFIMRTDLIGEL